MVHAYHRILSKNNDKKKNPFIHSTTMMNLQIITWTEKKANLKGQIKNDFTYNIFINEKL